MALEQAIELEELQTVIPHRGKMMLLSRVLEYDSAGMVRAEYDIAERCIFYDPAIQCVPSWAGFECIAQAISAFSGIRDREKNIKPKIGFILSIPFMRINIPFFKLGSVLDIHVRQIDRTGQVFTFDGEIFLEGVKAMEGKMMVMEIDNEQEFLNMYKECG